MSHYIVMVKVQVHVKIKVVKCMVRKTSWYNQHSLNNNIRDQNTFQLTQGTRLCFCPWRCLLAFQVSIFPGRFPSLWWQLLMSSSPCHWGWWALFCPFFPISPFCLHQNWSTRSESIWLENDHFISHLCCFLMNLLHGKLCKYDTVKTSSIFWMDVAFYSSSDC